MELLNRFFVLTIALTSISAQAKESSDDAQAQQRAKDPRVRIWCKDGSFFRGEPLEIIPRSHVLLQIAEGRTIRIEWDKIVRHDSPEMGAVPSPALPKRTESSAATRNDVSPAPQTRTAPPQTRPARRACPAASGDRPDTGIQAPRPDPSPAPSGSPVPNVEPH